MGVCDTRVRVSDTRVSVFDTRVSVSDTCVSVSETRVRVCDMCVSVCDTPVASGTAAVPGRDTRRACGRHRPHRNQVRETLSLFGALVTFTSPLFRTSLGN